MNGFINQTGNSSKHTEKVSSYVSPFSVRMLKYQDLHDELNQEWAELEERAVEGNAYLSPCFILPALKHLTPHARPLFILVEDMDSKLKGIGIFELSYGTKQMPLPHLKAYRSPHSFLTGLLIDADFVEPALTAFFSFLCQSKNPWHGVEFSKRYGDTELACIFDRTAAGFGYCWFEYERKWRAVLVPKESGPAYLERIFSPKKKKTLRNCCRHLESAGQVSWRLIKGKDIDLKTIDASLNLEHMGWKGENGTSLISQPSHEAFFREMTDAFSKRERASFAELAVNGKVISSTSNFISGKTGFAFKVGWNPAFSRMSPGILNEVEFVKNAVTLFPELDYIDSGAEEGSFIDELWTNRRLVVSGIYATTKIGKMVLSGIDRVRTIKQMCVDKGLFKVFKSGGVTSKDRRK